MGLPKEILEGYDKRHRRRDFGVNPSVRKVSCPVCKVGKLYRYSTGEWSLCDICKWSGVSPAK